MFQYYDEVPSVEAIEKAYLTCKPEQHRLTPKYYILSSFVPLVKHYHVTLEEMDKKSK